MQLNMIAKQNYFAEKLGNIIGFMVAFFISITILYLILSLRHPTSYAKIMIIFCIVILIGTLLKRILR